MAAGYEAFPETDSLGGVLHAFYHSPPLDGKTGGYEKFGVCYRRMDFFLSVGNQRARDLRMSSLMAFTVAGRWFPGAAFVTRI